MNQWILTSPNFIGEISVVYDIENQLVKIDFEKADLNLTQIQYFKDKCPAVWSEVWLKEFGRTQLKAVMVDYVPTFDEFWERYGRKINRLRCEPLWNKLGKADKVLAFAGVIKYNNHLVMETWKNKADPETYLRQRYWQNQWK